MSDAPDQQYRQQRLRALLVEKFTDNRAELGRALGYTSGAFVRQMLDGERPISEKTITRVHTMMGGKFAGWFRPVLVAAPAPRDPQSGGQSPQTLLQALSSSFETVHDLPLVTWGNDLLSEDLPERFGVRVPDDSMAPKVKAGAVIRCMRSTTARPGDGIIATDGAGNLFFRRYRERKPGSWQAVAENDAYQPLDSAEDGLRIIGVLIGVDERWG